MKNYIKLKSMFGNNYAVIDIPMKNEYGSYILQKLASLNIPFVSRGIMKKDGMSTQITFVRIKKSYVRTFLEEVEKLKSASKILGLSDYDECLHDVATEFEFNKTEG